VLRLSAGPLQLNAGLSPEVANAYTAVSVTLRALQAGIDEGKGMPESLTEAGAVKSFGAVPLIVLSRGVIPGKDQDCHAAQSEGGAGQDGLQLKTRLLETDSLQSGKRVARRRRNFQRGLARIPPW
jgi:hypothetical protein